MADKTPSISDLAGKFLVIDGPDGAGKGTQIRMLADLLAKGSVPCITAHDPGDTAAGDLIRQILLHSRANLAAITEVLLFMASRAQLVTEKIRPALAAGKAVICDRFISSTLAYQGAAGADPRQIIELGNHAVGDTWPDLTLVLDLPPEEGLRRIAAGRQVAADAMESRPLDFHRRVREVFRSLHAGKVYPKPVELVDAIGTPEDVHRRIVLTLARRFSV